MAGSNAAFDAAVFRQSIRSTMTMGLPTADADKPTFTWSTQNQYAVESPADNPYDWTATPTSTVTHAEVRVPCAIEFSARPAGSRETALGEFDTSRVIITVLDEDYTLIEGADGVRMGGNDYIIEFVAPPMGLFEVTVYQLYCQARDES